MVNPSTITRTKHRSSSDRFAPWMLFKIQIVTNIDHLAHYQALNDTGLAMTKLQRIVLTKMFREKLDRKNYVGWVLCTSKKVNNLCSWLKQSSFSCMQITGSEENARQAVSWEFCFRLHMCVNASASSHAYLLETVLVSRAAIPEGWMTAGVRLSVLGSLDEFFGITVIQEYLLSKTKLVLWRFFSTYPRRLWVSDIGRGFSCKLLEQPCENLHIFYFKLSFHGLIDGDTICLFVGAPV